MTAVLGGIVRRSGHREFGHAHVRVARNGDSESHTEPRLFHQVPSELRVWASHGDDVGAVPPGFAVAATSTTAPIVAMEAPDRQLYALLFHPEVVHTEHGVEILRNFAYGECGCTGDWTISSFIEESTERIRQQVGSGKVVCGLSGGVDSTVAAMLIHRAIGDRLTCIFVDNGLLGTTKPIRFRSGFKEKLRLPLDFVDASGLFLGRLARRHGSRTEAQDHWRHVHRRVREARNGVGRLWLSGTGDAVSRRDRVCARCMVRRWSSRVTTTLAGFPSE